MARTLYPAQVAQNYSEAKWSLADDNAQDETKPVAGDTIVLTSNSGLVTCDEAWACAELGSDSTGGLWAFGTQTATASVAIGLSNITATADAGAAITVPAFNHDTGSLTLSGDVTITGDYSITNGTIDTGGFELTVDGVSDILMDGTNTVTEFNLICGGTGTLTNTSTNSFDTLEINTAGTVILASNISCGDFTLSAAANLICTGYVITASGDVTRVAGTATNADIVMSNTGSTKSVIWSSFSPPLKKLSTLAGVTVNMAGNIVSKEYDFAGDDITFGAGNLWVYEALAGWWTQASGSLVSVPMIVNRTSSDPVGDITLNNTLLQFTTNSTHSITTASNINTGTGAIRVLGDGNGDLQTLIMNGSLNCGALMPGATTAVTGSGAITINATASCASVSTGNAVNGANVINFGGGSHIEISGLGDFANIAVTASVDMPPEIVCPDGGSVTNCVPDNEIALFGDASVDGGGNGENIVGPPGFVNNQKYPDGLTGVIGGRLIVPFWVMGMLAYSMMEALTC
jgi:hypothetical protein